MAGESPWVAVWELLQVIVAISLVLWALLLARGTRRGWFGAAIAQGAAIGLSTRPAREWCLGPSDDAFKRLIADHPHAVTPLTTVIERAVFVVVSEVIAAAHWLGRAQTPDTGKSPRATDPNHDDRAYTERRGDDMASTDPTQLMSRAERLRAHREQLGRPRDVDVGGLFQTRMTAGQRTADVFANVVGSWRFIIIQSIVLAGWITLNTIGVLGRWDPYPFILLNLALSFQAAYAAPIIMMSQNRASQLDRLGARADYQINQKAETEVEEILTLLRAQVALVERLQEQLRGPSAGG